MNEHRPQGLRRARLRGAVVEIFPRCTKLHSTAFQQKKPPLASSADVRYSDLSGLSAAKNDLSGLKLRTKKQCYINNLNAFFGLSGLSGLFLGRKGKAAASQLQKVRTFLHRSNATAGRSLVRFQVRQFRIKVVPCLHARQGG